jgi:hypothetical protein
MVFLGPDLDGTPALFNADLPSGEVLMLCSDSAPLMRLKVGPTNGQKVHGNQILSRFGF